MIKIILASASPRRKQLLKQINLKFDIYPANIRENILSDEKPFNYLKRITGQKVIHAAKKYPRALIIGADTVVIADNKIIGKPDNIKNAIDMLKRLQGKKHSVITGLNIYFQNKSIFSVTKTDVWMKKLTDKQIINYVNTKEPLDKAGGYGIQGLGAILIDRINGDYYNVVGLPLNQLSNSLKKAGVSII